MRRFLGVGSVLASLLAAGCAGARGGGCQRIRNHHEAFLGRAASVADAPHLTVSIPFAVLDRLVAAEVGRLPVSKLDMPEVAGFSLGSLGLRVEKVQARAAPRGRLGFVIEVGLAQGRRRVIGLQLDVVVTPRIDTRTGEIVVALEGRDIQGISPRLDTGSTRALADWIWGQLPEAARMFTSKAQIQQLAGGLSDELMADAFALVRRELLDDLGEITRIELDLPDLPLAAVQLRTDSGRVELEVHTSLPVEQGLVATGRPARADPGLVSVRFAGAAAAELGNYAMRTGAVPSRWTLDGEPDDEGVLHAGLAWDAGDAKPLVVHLWRLDQDCAHVRVGATPRVRIEGDRLVMSTDDARIEQVAGSLRVRAGIWFSGLGRRSFAFVEETAANLELEIAGKPLRARIESAAITSHELSLGLAVDVPPPARPRRP